MQTAQTLNFLAQSTSSNVQILEASCLLVDSYERTLRLGFAVHQGLVTISNRLIDPWPVKKFLQQTLDSQSQLQAT
jgi:hypothetical protein